MTDKEKIMYSQMYFALLMVEKQINLINETLCDMMISCPSFSDQIEECEEAADFLTDTITGLRDRIGHEMSKGAEENER